MAAELVVAGPGKPVIHKPVHDLELMFYVLVGMCVLLEHPHQIKVEDQLKCFDTYFNTFHPSIAKTTTVQSNIGWSVEILPHISPYFQPLIPLLNTLCEKIIIPMNFSDGRRAGEVLITHDVMLNALLETLCGLEDGSWNKILPPSESSDPQESIPALPPAASSGSSWDSESTNLPSPTQTDQHPPLSSCVSCHPPICAISGSSFSPAQSSSSASSSRRRLSSTEPDPSGHIAKRLQLAPRPPCTPPCKWYSATAPSAFHTKG